MTAPTFLDCNGKPLDLRRAQIMGILNVTPDSFSDGGRFLGRDAALHQAERMMAEGAAIIDVGGESTRPGAAAVGVEEELTRVIPVIEAIAAELPVPVSVDTSKAAVMEAAVAAGAGLINDVAALRGAGALAAAARCGVPVCLMHMQGAPRTMQQAPRYDDVVAEVHAFLAERKAACVAAGIPAERVVVDPGFGFGKTLEHNLRLMRSVEHFNDLGPVLVGVSRKSMIGAILDGAPVERRLNGGIALAAYAAAKGARILRVHDVKETYEAVRTINAVLGV
ncbi:dihydropteroate synthase [Endothiovibrio diazotrophicus]